MKRNFFISAAVLSSALSAHAESALFNFKTTTAISSADKTLLHAVLEAKKCAFSADGSVHEPDGNKLTERRAQEYLAARNIKTAPTRVYSSAKIEHGATLLLRRASIDPGLWDGSLAKASSDESAPAVDASGSGGAKRPQKLSPKPDAPKIALPAAVGVSAPQPEKSDAKIIYHKAKNPKTGPVGAKRFNPIWWVKNDDDFPPPADYRPKLKAGAWRDFNWWCRNPFTNFTNYVIGLEDRDFTLTGRYPDHVGNPNGGWNWTFIHYKWVRLPFISYTHKFKRTEFNFYLGWRPAGCLGAKLARQAIQPPHPARKTAP